MLRSLFDSIAGAGTSAVAVAVAQHTAEPSVQVALSLGALLTGGGALFSAGKMAGRVETHAKDLGYVKAAVTRISTQLGVDLSDLQKGGG